MLKDNFNFRDYKKVFNQIDLDDTGYINCWNLDKAYLSIGWLKTWVELMLVIEKVEPSKDEVITLADFISATLNFKRIGSY